MKEISEQKSRRRFLMQGSAISILAPIAAAQNSGKSSQTRNDCVFRRIVANQQEARKIWEDKDFVAFLDIKPINPGHTLLVPKKHFEYLFELEEPLYSRIFKRAKLLAKPLRATMQSQRIGMLVEGFGVAHLHIHLVPINKGDVFGSRKGNPATEEKLEKMPEKVRAAIKNTK